MNGQGHYQYNSYGSDNDLDLSYRTSFLQKKYIAVHEPMVTYNNKLIEFIDHLNIIMNINT